MPEKRTKLLIVDTTLRDGEQRAGLAFLDSQKIRCAAFMDAAGIYQIEAGIPSMGRREQNVIRTIINNRQNAVISTWNRMNRSDIEASFECRPDIIHISIPVSDIQIENKLRKTREYVEDEMKRCIDFAAGRGYEVTLGFEDASRAAMSYILRLAEAAVKMSVKRIRYADTVGVAFPSKIGPEIAGIISQTGVAVECHAHDDLGMAVANSIEAAKNGAQYINTTFLGIGERAGNCNFRQLVTASRGKFEFDFATGDEILLRTENMALDILEIENN